MVVFKQIGGSISPPEETVKRNTTLALYFSL